MTDFQADIFIFIWGVCFILFGGFLIHNPQKFKDWNIAMMTKKNGEVNFLGAFGQLNRANNISTLYLRFYGIIIICVGALLMYLSIYGQHYHPVEPSKPNKEIRP